ncbi:hypothetical protein GW17_00058424, partial [Ensete ventricosum]
MKCLRNQSTLAGKHPPTHHQQLAAGGHHQLFLFLPALELPRWKSSSTVLLHLGHLGSFSESMTYMRHRGHPASTMDVASGLPNFCSPSDDTHELGGDRDDDDDDDESSSSSSSTTALVDGPPLALICFPV